MHISTVVGWFKAFILYNYLLVLPLSKKSNFFNLMTWHKYHSATDCLNVIYFFFYVTLAGVTTPHTRDWKSLKLIAIGGCFSWWIYQKERADQSWKDFRCILEIRERGPTCSSMVLILTTVLALSLIYQNSLALCGTSCD